MIRLSFFHTSHCHLCEQAEALLIVSLDPARFEVYAIDIADDDRLLERYGTRIPVLRRESDGAELGWPFGPEDLAGFLAADSPES